MPNQQKGVESAKRPTGRGTWDLFRVWKALGYSLSGLRSTFRTEAAFRQELLMVLILFPLALWLPVDPMSRIWLIFSLFFLLIVELLNSAIETVVDYISLEQHPLAKKAKDVASAAVLLALGHLLYVWVYTLYVYRSAILGLE